MVGPDVLADHLGENDLSLRTRFSRIPYGVDTSPHHLTHNVTWLDIGILVDDEEQVEKIEARAKVF